MDHTSDPMQFWHMKPVGFPTSILEREQPLHEPHRQLSQQSAKCCEFVSMAVPSPPQPTTSHLHWWQRHLPWLTSAEAQGICIHVLHSFRYLLMSYTYVWTKSCPPPTIQAESSRVWIMFQKQHIFSTSDSVGRVTEAWRLKEWTLTHHMLTKAICFLSTGPCLTHEK